MPTAQITTVPTFTSIEPSVTDLLITQGEDGSFHGWGHLDPVLFLDAVYALERHWQNMDENERHLLEESRVEHLWAVPDRRNPEECWRWVSRSTPNAVPITTVSF